MIVLACLTIFTAPYTLDLMPLNCMTMGLFLLICVLTITLAALRTSVDARHPSYDSVILTGISKRRLLGGYIAFELIIQSPFTVMAILMPAFGSMVFLEEFVPEHYFALAIYITTPTLWLFALLMGISTGLAFRRPVMAVSIGVAVYGLALILWVILLVVLAVRINNLVQDPDITFHFRLIAEWFFLTTLLPYVFFFIALQVAYEDVDRPNASLDDFLNEDEEDW
ncbi:MAG: hypothetical protein L0154_24590 [Chloroflexi bacterium]|nr:hypothetical protein [Chloroflexota bacterium]